MTTTSEPSAREVLCIQLKGLAAQRLYGVGAYYEVVNPLLNGAYRRAAAILADWDREGRPLLEGPEG